MGGVTALGDAFAALEPALREGWGAVRRMPEWDRYVDLQTRLGAPVDSFTTLPHLPRKVLRSMGRVALLGLRSAELALEDAGLLGRPSSRRGGRASPMDPPPAAWNPSSPWGPVPPRGASRG